MLEQRRSIGFNDDVRCGTRLFHVQTEVVGTDGMTVRSTVVENGIVRLMHKRLLPPELDDLATAAAFVEAHHQETLQKAASGDIE